MAPSNKSFLLVALLFAVAMPWLLQPSSAAFSFPPFLPCLPFLPRIPLFPCIEPPPLPPTPTECLPSIMKIMPCGGYLTNISVTVPPSACCEGLSQIIEVDYTTICLCHLANGDIQKLLPAPMIFHRMVNVTEQCNANLAMNALVRNCKDLLGVPPMTLPSPPPSVA